MQSAPDQAATGEIILVSACLMGEIVRYDGKAKRCIHPQLLAWHDSGKLLKFCPEVAAGLSTPRPAAEIQQGDGGDVLDGRSRVVLENGIDVSAAYLRGARAALQQTRQHAIHFALLKANSPSCGNEAIYNGTFSRSLHHGAGVTTALLKRQGIQVFNENQIEALNTALIQFEQHR